MSTRWASVTCLVAAVLLAVGAAVTAWNGSERAGGPEPAQGVELPQTHLEVADVPAGQEMVVRVPVVNHTGRPARVVGSGGQCNQYCCFDLKREVPFEVPPGASEIECKVKANEPGRYTI